VKKNSKKSERTKCRSTTGHEVVEVVVLVVGAVDAIREKHSPLIHHWV
jgi:hypothetical protein